MILHSLRPAQLAAEVLGGAIHRDLFRWLGKVTNAINWWCCPPSTVITVALTADAIAAHFNATGLGLVAGPYDGWAICNGNNDTPNLSGKFLRISTTESGGVGGSDTSAHTHAIDHDHGSFTSGAEAAHTHSTPSHAHQTEFGWDSSAFYGKGANPASGSIVEAGVDRMTTTSGVTNDTGSVRIGSTRTDGGGTSGAGSSHSHSVDAPAHAGTSGAASATDNMPAYYELVALMRVERNV
jgi:hypothetical protein